MDHVAWAMVNLGVPFIGPIFVVKIIRILLSEKTHSELRKRLRVTYLFREGQYALTSIAVVAASVYELSELGEWSQRSKLWLAGFAFLLLIAAMLVVIGLIAETEDPESAIPPGTGVLRLSTISRWIQTYRVGAATALLALPVCVLAYQVHAASATSRAETAPKSANVSPSQPTGR